MSGIIVIDPNTLREDFPYFNGVSDSAIASASLSVNSYISNVLGAINLSSELQIRGNYLACCHILYLSQNPGLTSTVPLASASEGDVNASFRDFKNFREKLLSLTPYGLELLAILETVRPPTTQRPMSPHPYYRGTYVGWN